MKNEHHDMTYVAALQELETLVIEMEKGEVSVDELSAKVKRAVFLVQFCKKKLRTAEEEVRKTMEEAEVKGTEKGEFPRGEEEDEAPEALFE